MTYVSGFKIRKNDRSCSLTNKDIVTLCDEYSRLLGYDVEPLSKCEGGLLLKNPGNGYKCITFACNMEWPWLNGDELEKWRGSDTFVVVEGYGEIETVLKAYDGAPIWTIDELNKLEQALTVIECKRVGRMVRKESLVRIG